MQIRPLQLFPDTWKLGVKTGKWLAFLEPGAETLGGKRQEGPWRGFFYPRGQIQGAKIEGCGFVGVTGI